MTAKRSMARSIISAAASGDRWSPRSSMARASRAWAWSWWPSRCSTPAQADVSRTRNVTDSAGTRVRRSSSASWPWSNWPVAISILARARSSSTRRSAGAACGRRRSASPNQVAALAGARCAAASPASRSVAIAALSPCLAECWRWCARSAGDAPRAASTSAHRACAPSRQPAASTRTPLAAPAGGGTGTGAAPRCGGQDRAQQLIDGFQRHRLRDRRRRSGEVGFERIACHRRTLQHEAGTVGQQRESPPPRPPPPWRARRRRPPPLRPWRPSSSRPLGRAAEDRTGCLHSRRRATRRRRRRRQRRGTRRASSA